VTKYDETVTSHHFVTVPHSNPGPGSGKIPAWNDPHASGGPGGLSKVGSPGTVKRTKTKKKIGTLPVLQNKERKEVKSGVRHPLSPVIRSGLLNPRKKERKLRALRGLYLLLYS